MLEPSSDLSQAFRTAVDHHVAGDLEGAAAAYRDILLVAPAHAGALHLLGVVNGQRGDHWTALDLIQQALRYDPRSPEAHYNLGFNLGQLGDFIQASECYRHALALKPDYYEAINNLGHALGELGLWTEAAEQFRNLIALMPNHAPAHNNLGNALLNQRRLPNAVQAYRQALEINPNYSTAHSNLLFALNHDPGIELAQLFAEHKNWATAHAPPAENPRVKNGIKNETSRCLRVGYVSGDFWDHAVCSSFELLLEHHDRGKVEVHCYSNHHRSDAVTRRLQKHSEHWATIAEEDNATAAARIRRDKIDLLVDLSGHTARNRLQLFALKPAPLQVTWLGYPNTTGLHTIDYRVTDRIADPEGHADQLHTESLVRLDRCFLCYRPPNDAPLITLPPARSLGHVTFGSFNNLTKVTANVIRVWSRILHSVPGSRLLLKSRQLADSAIQRELLAEFALAGITPDRLLFRPRTISKAGHMADYGQMDVALDTFPYNGTMTTNEALWMGVPVVTIRGNRHAARVGASLLTAVGLNDLIATDEDHYVSLATAIGHDIERLSCIRANLRDRMRHSELCVGSQFASAIENVYREMWLAWCNSRFSHGPNSTRL
jgi:protein O-GlcNAc transferase